LIAGGLNGTGKVALKGVGDQVEQFHLLGHPAVLFLKNGKEDDPYLDHKDGEGEDQGDSDA
jgi:hypothetical protein